MQILIPILSSLSSFILIYVLRFIDLYEKEPYKLILINFIFGVISYLISGLLVSELYELISVNNLALNYGKIYIFLSLLLSSMVMILSQILFSIISLNLFKKDFDTMPDYLIYFATIGIGFNFGEVFFFQLLNRTKNSTLLQISDNLYFSTFFTGTTLPFLIAVIGAAFYLLKIGKTKNIKSIFNISIGIFLIALITQILFYSVNYFFVTSPFVINPNKLILIKEIKFFAGSISISLLIACIGFAVLFDAYIVTTFIEKIINSKKIEQEKFGSLSKFINPFSYLTISNLKIFSNLKYSAKISDKETKSFVKLALNDFNDSKNSRIYIEEALEIICKS
tara:strand:- start:1690 stop:2700 length:1011 start_codon:yes stop_codon:yes gene_type:complete